MALETFLTDKLAPALTREVEEFLDSQQTGHPFQFPQWVDPGSKLMVLRDGGRIRWSGVFGMHLPLGWKVPWIRAAVANRGPVCDDRELWESTANELAVEMTRASLAYFDVSPDWIQNPGDEPLRYFAGSGWRSIGPEPASLRLSLIPAEEEIFANFSKTTRYEVRRAERAGVLVSTAIDDAEIDEFSHLYKALASRKGFHPDSTERMRRQIRWLIGGASRGALLLARVDNIVCGGAVVGRAGRRCWYIWGASEKQQQLNVGHILQWKALQWAKAQGCTEYDFGGYTPGATSGPAWFKAGFGGVAVRLVAPHRRVIRAGSHRVFSLLSKIR